MGIKNYDTLMKYIKIGYDDADNMKSHYKQLANTYTDIKELQSWKGGQDYIKFCTEYKNLLDRICDVTNSYGTAMAKVKTKLQAYDKLILLGWDFAIFQKVKKKKIDIPKKTDNVLFQAPLVELIQKRLKNNAAFFSDVYQRAIQVKKNLSQESMLAFNGSTIQKNLSAVSDELNRLAIKLAKIIEKYDKAETTAQKNAKDLNGWNTYITVNGKKYNCYDTHKEIFEIRKPPKVPIYGGYELNVSVLTDAGGMYNQYDSRYNGVVSWWEGEISVGCTATSIAAYFALLTGERIDPKKFWTADGAIYITSWTQQKGYTYHPVYNNNHNQQYIKKVIYERIVNMHEPIVLNNNSPHTVVAIGIKENADPNNLKNSDIIVFDPVHGVTTTYDKTQGGKGNISFVQYYTKK